MNLVKVCHTIGLRQINIIFTTKMVENEKGGSYGSTHTKGGDLGAETV